ncbi:transposase, partial [Ottowia sp.]|uniref:transposase n=1 Tax=Ottowia sp. TaxID=1898956 RepID=UPI002B5784F2
MTKQPYPEEFKIEAVKQITERGHRVADVSARIGVSQHSLYKWVKAYAVPAPERHEVGLDPIPRTGIGLMLKR